MKIFNSIQIVILLMLAPTLLSWCHNATFAGAQAMFWTGLIGTAALAIVTMALVHEGMD